MNGRGSILVVEDEAAIREGLCDLLTFHGFHPMAHDCGEDGLRSALADDYALVLLDIMLPGLSGFDVCRELRSRRPALPILMLTARGSESDVIEGFRCGADDYVTKPFSVAELMARIEALLRRSGHGGEPQSFGFGAWTVDASLCRAACVAGTVELSPREVRLLAVFARDRGRIISRRTLLAEVWGMRHVEEIRTRTVDMHIAKLRRKLSALAADGIDTVRGAGYRFTG